MTISSLAGKAAPSNILVDLEHLETNYFEQIPNLSDKNQLVSFGTSGHRGSSLNATFTEAHILAIAQAICEYRKIKGTNGPVYVGKDTHALSDPAQETLLQVLAANEVSTIIQCNNGPTPTPVISHAILTYNKGRTSGLADGIVITPSHNPPEDGGIKYNPTNGGPADTDVTRWIENRSNELLKSKILAVKRRDYSSSGFISPQDLIQPYVNDLASVIDLNAIGAANLKLAADPLGGAALPYWEAISSTYNLNIAIVNASFDPQFAFMTVDHDGKIRMDCSSPYAMASLVKLKDQYSLAFANDPDADRHGIITPTSGLMNPNHYLAVAIDYLLQNRPNWSKNSAIGKTVVSSSLIDRVVKKHNRKLLEVPVGFKWFAPGLFDGSVCFGGEESAGASFLRRDGTVWSTDKDGLIMSLLAAEITAVTGQDPGQYYNNLTAEFGSPFYKRIDAAASPEQKAKLQKLSPEQLSANTLAGDKIVAKMTTALGNGAAIGGLKVSSENGWFAARPSGTENIYKIYSESFVSSVHLDSIIDEAHTIVNSALCS